MRSNERVPLVFATLAIIGGTLGFLLGLILIAAGDTRSGASLVVLSVVCALSGASVRALVKRRKC